MKNFLWKFYDGLVKCILINTVHNYSLCTVQNQDILYLAISSSTKRKVLKPSQTKTNRDHKSQNQPGALPARKNVLRYAHPICFCQGFQIHSLFRHVHINPGFLCHFHLSSQQFLGLIGVCIMIKGCCNVCFMYVANLFERIS